MTAVVGRAWGWVRSWGSYAVSEKTRILAPKDQERGVGDWIWGRTFWLWGGWRHQCDQTSSGEEYWEAQEKLQPVEIEDLGTGRKETDKDSEQVSRLWKYLPTSYLFWSGKTRPSEKKHNVKTGDVRDCDADGNYSDYGTPPPSPTPPSSFPLTSPFRLFANKWKVEVLPEHHDICFNFLRHLFDLCVICFLWTVSPPAKLILEVLGVQGALRLWLHGMAMFFVSTVGMAGLLWLIQEYLPQFALIYGIAQGLVLSVSVRQSMILCTGEEEKYEEDGETDGMKDKSGLKEPYMPVQEKANKS